MRVGVRVQCAVCRVRVGVHVGVRVGVYVSYGLVLCACHVC